MSAQGGAHGLPAPFTKKRGEVPKQDDANFGLLVHGSSSSQAGRPERKAPFMLTEAAHRPPFFNFGFKGNCGDGGWLSGAIFAA
jgi:hypothetical protein